MFVILLSYTAPIDVVDQTRAAHLAFLDECYQQNQLLMSGRQTSEKGGVLISHLKTLEAVHDLISKDPYHLTNVAKYEIIEFTPSKYQKEITPYI